MSEPEPQTELSPTAARMKLIEQAAHEVAERQLRPLARQIIQLGRAFGKLRETER